MKLPSAVNKHKWLIIGGGVGILAIYALSRAKRAGVMLPSTPPLGQGMMARSSLGRQSIADPGVDDLDNQVNWVAAGPDPSAYSNLTLRNENRLYGHLPYISLASSAPNHWDSVQGSFGFTAGIGTGFTTYF